MNIGLIETIGGKYKIVDIDDDNAPLITFHNELNKNKFPTLIFNYICSDSAKNDLKKDDIEK